MTSSPRPRSTPRPRTAAATFVAELEHFRVQAEGAVQFLAAYLAVNNAAVRDLAIYSALNASPLYWTTSQAALQKATFLALGRIFDQDSDHNINRLVGIAQDNPAIFAKDALRERKRGNNPTEPDWLADYVAEAYEPTADDFRAIRKALAQKRKVYERAYRPLRNSFFAHSETIDRDEIQALFAETNIGELQHLLDFLCGLHNALRDLYQNGSKLDLASSRADDLRKTVTQEAEAMLSRLVKR